jgi:hypothetical protein
MLRNRGVIDVETTYAGNGAEVQARKPEDCGRSKKENS